MGMVFINCDGAEVPNNARKNAKKKLDVDDFRKVRDVMKSLGKWRMTTKHRKKNLKGVQELWQR